MQVQPYLMFDGRCEEAIRFYQSALAAEIIDLMRFSDGPDGAACGPDGKAPPADKVMHAALKIGEATVMVSDGMCTGAAEFKGFSLTLDAPDEAAAKQLFEALGQGGTVQMPLAKTFFSPCFGMVADRFGVSWMVIVH